MYMYTLLSFYTHTHNIVLKQDLTNSIILCTSVALLFCSSAIFVIFVRANSYSPKTCLFIEENSRGKMEKNKKWACIEIEQCGS